MTEVATVLPNELRLGAPPTMPQARSYLFRQQSTLQSYSAGNQIQINIPRLQRSYLRKDSYLRFALDITETGSSSSNVNTKNLLNTLTFDSAGGFGLIQKIEVFDYLGSTVLESISEVPQLMALLLDMGLSEIDQATNGQTSMGLENGFTSGDQLGYTPDGDVNPVDTAIVFNQNNKFRPASSGRTLRRIGDGNNTGAAVNGVPPYSAIYSTEISIPLPSFLGFLSKKMVPLHNGFTILITLVPSVTTAFFHPGATVPGASISIASGGVLTGSHTALDNLPSPTGTDLTYTMTISDVYMECQILELGPVAESMILSSTGGQPLVVHTKSFRSYVGTVLAKAQEFVLNLNLNVASMTNLLWMMRSNAQLDNINHQSIGNRTRNMLQRWFFQYGSTTLPQNNGIQTMGSTFLSTAGSLAAKYSVVEGKCTEGYMELMKARPVELTSSRITQESYAWDLKYGTLVTTDAAMGAVLNTNSYVFATPQSAQWVGKFAGGLNLELANGKSGNLISGLNTNGMNTSIRGAFHPLFTDYMDTVRVDAYAEYDAFINVSPGIATTVSF